MTLDTPMNRKNMSNADFSQWTTLEYVAEYVCDTSAFKLFIIFETMCVFHLNNASFSWSRLLFGWSEGKDRPDSGSLVKLNTKDGKSSWDLHTGSLI